VLSFSIHLYSTGQEYTPTTNWPYLFENFQDGTIHFKEGDNTLKKVNIHLHKNTLHYVENDKIYQIDDKNDIDFVEINNEKFVYKNKELLQVIQQIENNGLYLLAKVDLDKLTTATGAYGSNAQTASTRNLTNLDFVDVVNIRYVQLISGKEEGRLLPLKKSYYFDISGELIPANKKEVEKRLETSQVKEEYKQFVKKNKIKWNQANSLIQVLEFLNNHSNK
jgi:hypothetical protein